MKFYNQQHQYYCGIDLHARKMYVCILDQKGKAVIHENINTDPELFFQLISPYVEDDVRRLCSDDEAFRPSWICSLKK